MLAAVEAGDNRITRRLRERGFSDPVVDITLDYRRPTNTVVVTVTADLGGNAVSPLTYVNSERLTGYDPRTL